MNAPVNSSQGIPKVTRTHILSHSHRVRFTEVPPILASSHPRPTPTSRSPPPSPMTRSIPKDAPTLPRVVPVNEPTIPNASDIRFEISSALPPTLPNSDDTDHMHLHTSDRPDMLDNGQSSLLRSLQRLSQAVRLSHSPKALDKVHSSYPHISTIRSRIATVDTYI